MIMLIVNSTNNRLNYLIVFTFLFSFLLNNSTSQDTHSKFRTREKRLAKALEFDKIKPLKLFSKSLPLKSESGKIPKREPMKSIGRETSPVPPPGLRTKVACSAPVTGRVGPSVTESKVSKAVTIKCIPDPDHQVTAIVLQSDNIDNSKPNSSCNRNELEVSLTLSVATELPDSQFYPLFCEKSKQQQHVAHTQSISNNIENSPESTIHATVFSIHRSEKLENCIDETGRSVDPSSVHGGRDSPTLSELSQEDQYQHTDSESDNTEIFVGNEVLNSGRRDKNDNTHHDIIMRSHDSKINIKCITDNMNENNIDVSNCPISRNGQNLDFSAECGRGTGTGTGTIDTPNSPLRWRRGQAIGEGTFGRVYKGNR